MITLTMEDHDLRIQLQQGSATVQLAFQRAMRDIVAVVHRGVAANMGKGGLIGVRTGTMRRAIKDEVTFDASGTMGRVYMDPTMGRYFDIQEEGGTIVPKMSKFLTIPLAAMVTGNGVARGTARDVIANPGAFGFTGTFFAKGLLFGKEGRSVVPLFALKSSVTIPGRHYMQQTLAGLVDWIQQRLEDATGEIVQRVDATGGAA